MYGQFYHAVFYHIYTKIEVIINVNKTVLSKYRVINDRSLNKKALCRIFSKPARCVIWVPWNMKSIISLITQSENLNHSSGFV